MKTLMNLMGQPLVYGKNDCNLMVLKWLNSPIYDEIYGRYTTRIGGFRVANKVVGTGRMSDWLAENCDLVDVNYARQGDIVIDPSTQDCLIYLGVNFFGVRSETKSYGTFRRSELDLDQFLFYRGRHG